MLVIFYSTEFISQPTLQHEQHDIDCLELNWGKYKFLCNMYLISKIIATMVVLFKRTRSARAENFKQMKTLCSID